jgi:hypothetical protein
LGVDGSDRKSLVLETIVAVGVASAGELPQTRGRVSRQKQRAPALVLFDVDALVPTATLEAVAVAPQNDVAQGQGLDTRGR